MGKQLMYSYQERTAANKHKTNLINMQALDHTWPGLLFTKNTSGFSSLHTTTENMPLQVF